MSQTDTAPTVSGQRCTTLAVVTGTSRGLGAALAHQLLGPDACVIALARQDNPALAGQARSTGARLHQLTGDLSDPVQLQRLCNEMIAALPRKAERMLLINNAGTVAPIVPVEALQAEAIHQASQAMQLNIVAPMALTAAFLQASAGRSQDRRVLNISSGAGRNPMAGWATYCTTKAALDMYTRVLKQEQATLGAQGARVVALAPGVVDTGMQGEIRAADPAAFPALARFQALHTDGQLSAPEHVAERILIYLARADFGQTEIDDIRNYD
ncbi:SDR family oxidoreductase [Corticimicrobacter populi]|uniref:Short chain dehydrogenase n=1 Tax=Corticimicrobacter populi TaxID=2175229 RepID=A0A2V1K1D6_9BURK|nr:SDR family oxidoreductase [Corticimicrobacter populi]PWF24951.1 short chain dehydrogenase [Corticimicrobacter populi]